MTCITIHLHVYSVRYLVADRLLCYSQIVPQTLTHVTSVICSESVEGNHFSDHLGIIVLSVQLYSH